jgi:hypothetical protein
MIKKTKHYSYKTGNLAQGCKLCVKGKKSVLFTTGVCPRNCFFCPISDYKKNKDVIFINELELNELELSKLKKEIRLCNSKGVGITGGDPLSKLERTAGFIKVLKKDFGDKFHIHLYTSFNLLTKDKLKKLFNAGLDEIRFHPDLDDASNWDKIKLVKDFSWSIGVEVPLIPNKKTELLKMINYFKDYVDFFNFNEFEMSDNKQIDKFKENYSLEDNSSYAVKDSLRLGLDLLKYCDLHNLNSHLCSVKLKDKVQLANRIKRRAKNVKLKTDILTPEGLLKRGVIYCQMIPGVNYEEELNRMSLSDINKELKELKNLKEKLVLVHNIPENKLFIDKKNLRILTSIKIARKLAPKIRDACGIVLEYPTADNLLVELELLK